MSTGKDVQHLQLLGKYKLKWDITTHLSEWLKLRTVTTPNVGEDAEKLDHSYIAGGNVKR